VLKVREWLASGVLGVRLEISLLRRRARRALRGIVRAAGTSVEEWKDL